ncbi:hypothetical protein HPG69_016344 [Diceros bicornis minor]|uniref:SCO-spondin n=1 Tax=Diceros bicornis minor TaxID=77932 RepID=A0A7J7ETG1_DICBM|nr:hypothetical protein HPG69_016344 [Diceros bicornis minor]
MPTLLPGSRGQQKLQWTLSGGRCLPLSQCPCLVGEELKQPGVPFLLDNCSQCTCEKGVLLCESGGCPVPCGWSAWSSWGPCDRSCGSGVRARFRSPSNPPAASGGAPCEGDRQEVQACHTECGTGLPNPARTPTVGCPSPAEALGWTPWAPWSSCSLSCLVPGGGPGWRSRSRLCPSPRNTSCPGEATQEEPCSPPVCPGMLPSPWGCLGTGVDPLFSCPAQCPGDMVFRSAEQCRQEGGPCPRLCLAQGPGVECTAFCAPGCTCPPGLFLHNASCLPHSQCPCQLHGQLYAPGAVAQLDSCNNCRSCNVGIRRRFRAGTAPPAAFGGAVCQGPNMEAKFCSLRPCQGTGGEWSPWSPCSVPCGGGYRNRTRGSGPHSPMDFSTCGLQPCAGPVPGMCPRGKRWLDCAQGPASCAELSAPQGTNQTCHPGCYCPSRMLLLVSVLPAWPLLGLGTLVARKGQAGPGQRQSQRTAPVSTGGTSTPQAALCFVRVRTGQPTWSPWTPWSECSASCGPARRHRHRFCTRPPGVVPSSEVLLPPLASATPLCPGPEAEEEPCLLPGCDLTNCTAIQGAEYSHCGPPCPRSCDDLVHCVWHCQPGCYCPPGQVLSADGAICVQPGHCSCLDLLTGERHRPGTQLARPDGCNYCAWQLVPVVGVDSVHPALQGPDKDPLQGLHLPRSSAQGGPVPWGGRGGRGPASEGDLPRPHHVPRNALLGPHNSFPPSLPNQGDGVSGLACATALSPLLPPQECPCVLTASLLQELGAASADPGARPPILGEGGQPLGPGDELGSGQTLRVGCSNCSCAHGKLSCSVEDCSKAGGGFGPWGPWDLCSRSCGGLGTRTRSRQCARPTPTPGGQGCLGPRQDLEYCLSPDCPGAGGSTVEPVTGLPEEGCPAGMEVVSCANRCPRRCSDLQEGIVCQDGQACQRGCRCSEEPGAWTLWSSWSDCPVSCGGGNQVRTRVCVALASRLQAPRCLGPDTQTQHCGQQPCPGLPEACSWGPWGPCSSSCGPGLASRSGSCPCLLVEADPTCNGTFLHLDTKACYPGPCLEECVWSSWSSWTPCSCQVPVQQRYRHQGPAPERAQEGPPCTRLDGHFRPCLISNCSEDSCTPPFEFQACGSPCARLCATHLSRGLCQDLPPCQPGCYCPEGLLEQAGGCIPPEECGCLHISGEGAGVTLAPGDRLQLGCKECECWYGELQCTSRGCQAFLVTPPSSSFPTRCGLLSVGRVTGWGAHTLPFLGLLPLSGWSEWSPCGPCLPAGVLAPASRATLEERWPRDPASLSPTLAPTLASEQHRHRLCLDPETGRPWAGDPDLCTAPLSQQRLCPDPQACHDLCQWSLWGPWSPCQVPCSGGFRLRWREAGVPPGGGCRGPWAQTESCSVAPCPGESCESRDTVPTPDCANRCPRSCADLWDRVQCLQGPCRPGGQAMPTARPGNPGDARASSILLLPESMWPGGRGRLLDREL